MDEAKNTKEKKFSLGYFDEEYLKKFPAGIVQRDGKIVAFTNIFSGVEREELSRGPHAASAGGTVRRHGLSFCRAYALG